jgi:hypothetical protein
MIMSEVTEYLKVVLPTYNKLNNTNYSIPDELLLNYDLDDNIDYYRKVLVGIIYNSIDNQFITDKLDYRNSSVLNDIKLAELESGLVVY